VLDAMIGTSTAFEAFRARLGLVAPTPATVLLVGESGCGKGLAAREVHAASRVAGGPCIEVGLAALAPTLFEAELFGHVQGAFTGADRGRLGRFRRAHGGTLVLDDVDLLPPEIQVKLLRVLQERVIEPIGAEHGEPVEVRVVATTQRDLRVEVEQGRFRRDLYYRLAVVVLEVPPLRSRLDDLPGLCEHLIARLAQERGLEPRSLSPRALERFRAHAWPGNVRELENALERALVLAEGDRPRASSLEAEDFAFLDERAEGVADLLAAQALSHGLTLADLERALMERALREQHGNLSAAARQVGLTRRAAEYRLAHRRGDLAADVPSEERQA
jgi:DNA-binding NtrC family response regulator